MNFLLKIGILCFIIGKGELKTSLKGGLKCEKKPRRLPSVSKRFIYTAKGTATDRAFQP
jgi:hypothetical protein